MSQNNTIRKSDKRFIRREKARIRVQFFDRKKQEEMINELYKKFLSVPVVVTPAPAKEEPEKAEKPKAEAKKEEPKKKVVKKEKAKAAK